MWYYKICLFSGLFFLPLSQPNYGDEWQLLHKAICFCTENSSRFQSLPPAHLLVKFHLTDPPVFLKSLLMADPPSLIGLFSSLLPAPNLEATRFSIYLQRVDGQRQSFRVFFFLHICHRKGWLSPCFFVVVSIIKRTFVSFFSIIKRKKSQNSVYS